MKSNVILQLMTDSYLLSGIRSLYLNTQVIQRFCLMVFSMTMVQMELLGFLLQDTAQTVY